jgi:uncharacterized membrane protein YhiD involved in acid resistance
VTTAATLWIVAALGVACGAGYHSRVLVQIAELEHVAGGGPTDNPARVA